MKDQTQVKTYATGSVTDSLELDEEDETNFSSKKAVYEPEIILLNGISWYPWQMEQMKSSSVRRQESFNEVIKLKASIASISATGNMTITFNKPIIVPWITVSDAPVFSPHNSRLLDGVDEKD